MADLTPAEFLAALNTHGEEAGSDLNDGDETPGWFGWSITNDVLTATYTPSDEGIEPVKQTAAWMLVPITGPAPAGMTAEDAWRAAADAEVLAATADLDDAPSGQR